MVERHQRADLEEEYPHSIGRREESIVLWLSFPQGGGARPSLDRQASCFHLWKGELSFECLLHVGHKQALCLCCLF